LFCSLEDGEPRLSAFLPALHPFPASIVSPKLGNSFSTPPINPIHTKPLSKALTLSQESFLSPYHFHSISVGSPLNTKISALKSCDFFQCLYLCCPLPTHTYTFCRQSWVCPPTGRVGNTKLLGGSAAEHSITCHWNVGSVGLANIIFLLGHDL